MRATRFIPEQYKMDVRRYGSSDVPSGTPHPFSTTPEVQKEISRILGSYSADAILYDNKPLHGYHIMVDTSIQIFHPDGYALNLTTYNIGIILRECNINQGMIDDELIFVFDKSYREYILVPYNKDTYTENKKQSDEFFAAKTGTDKLTYGCTVNYNGTEFIFLGTKWVSSSKDSGIKTVQRNIVLQKTTAGSVYYIMSVRNPDAISNNTIGTYPDESDLIKTISSTDLYEITTFYKTGGFNRSSVDFKKIYISNDKPKKSDLKIEIHKITGKNNSYYSTYPGLPLFESDDGNIYVSMSGYGKTLSYNISTYDIGSLVRSAPYDINTNRVDISVSPNGSYSNVAKRKIVNLMYAKVVKK